MKKLAQDVGFAARFYQSIAVFLADRLRMTTTSLGTEGLHLEESIEDADELASHLMANVSMAGVRFAEMQRRHWGTSDSWPRDVLRRNRKWRSVDPAAGRTSSVRWSSGTSRVQLA